MCCPGSPTDSGHPLAKRRVRIGISAAAPPPPPPLLLRVRPCRESGCLEAASHVKASQDHSGPGSLARPGRAGGQPRCLAERALAALYRETGVRVSCGGCRPAGLENWPGPGRAGGAAGPPRALGLHTTAAGWAELRPMGIVAGSGPLGPRARKEGWEWASQTSCLPALPGALLVPSSPSPPLPRSPYSHFLQGKTPDSQSLGAERS